MHVVIAGRPNVGKSSLLNRLAGEERAIVAAVPGTTRDALRESIQIEGVPLVIVDTAACMHRGQFEQLGMERTRSEMARADLRWVCSMPSIRSRLPNPCRAAQAH